MTHILPIRLNANKCVGDRCPRELNLCVGAHRGIAFKLQLRSYNVHRDDPRFRPYMRFSVFCYGTFLGLAPWATYGPCPEDVEAGYARPRGPLGRLWDRVRTRLAARCCSNGITLFGVTLWACREDFYWGGRIPE